MGSSLTGRQPCWGKWELRSCPPRSQQQGSLRRRRRGVALDRGEFFFRAFSAELCTFLPSNNGFKIIFPTKDIIYDLVQAGQQGVLCRWQGATFFRSGVNELPSGSKI